MTKVLCGLGMGPRAKGRGPGTLAILSACACLGVTTGARATPAYTLAGSYALPSGSWDVQSDGRLIAVQDDGSVVRQDTLNSSTYSTIGSVDPAIFNGPFGNFGPGFIRLSPDGSTLAIGDNGANGKVYFLQVTGLNTSSSTPTTSITSDSYEAAWAGNSTLYVSSGFSSSSQVSRLDLGTSSVTTVIAGGLGASGGVTIQNGRLYTSDGFNTNAGGAPTGNVRAFDLSALNSASSSISFLSGTLVADALSGDPLGFDPQGDLLVGGGDQYSGSNDFGYAAVFDASDIAAALAGGSYAPTTQALHLSPAGPGVSPYNIQFDAATNELLVTANGTAYRYAIPAPTSAALLALTGVFATRRRRS